MLMRNNGITYSLDDSASGRFSIDAMWVWLQLQDGLSSTTRRPPAIPFTIRATSADGSFTTRTSQFNSAMSTKQRCRRLTIRIVRAIASKRIRLLAPRSVSRLLAIDSDGTDAVTYSLDDDASGRFAIDSTYWPGYRGRRIDREVASSYAITIRATSTDGSFTTRSYTIAVEDVDEFNVQPISDITQRPIVSPRTPRLEPLWELRLLPAMLTQPTTP